jgi:hypothetical protein
MLIFISKSELRLLKLMNISFTMWTTLCITPERYHGILPKIKVPSYSIYIDIIIFLLNLLILYYITELLLMICLFTL